MLKRAWFSAARSEGPADIQRVGFDSIRLQPLTLIFSRL
jgi:hypothetical protein